MRTLVVLGVLGAISGHAIGQERTVEDKSFVFGLGPAAERDLKNKSTSYGTALTVEKTVIDDRLEIEVGATRLNSAGRRQMELDVLFKKPFTLSPTAEVMVGLGPQLARKLDGAERGTSLGIECVLDFMFWFTEAKNIGWYVEPSHGLGLGNSKGERSLAGSAGLLIRWP